jgi:cell division protein FtsZ
MDHPELDKNDSMKWVFDDDLGSEARIKVIGVGGGGGNAVNRMVRMGVQGVDFIAANTDLQALRQSKAGVRIQLGSKITKGLGAGSNPEIGRQAALEDTELIMDHLEGSDMVFVTAGLGGGTGTGGAPLIADLARQLGALSVAVVTTPFVFEGRRRTQQAQRGLEELKENSDTVVTVPNEQLLDALAPGTPLADAFAFADDVLSQAVQGIADLINVPGFINLDFADIKTIMSGAGLALMGTGVGEGEGRAVTAASSAVGSPLLADATIQGARGVLINITAGDNLTLHEVNEASGLIQNAADPDANIIFGSVLDQSMGDRIKITVIATGFNGSKNGRQDRVAEAVADSRGESSLPDRTNGKSVVLRPIPVISREVEVPAILRQGRRP